MQKKTLRLALPLFGLAALSLTSSAQDFQPRMGEPMAGLSSAQLQRFADGLVEFNFVLSPADGLGPVFNDNSCGTCHAFPEPGGSGTKLVTRFGKAASGGNPFDPLAHKGGSLKQEQAIDPAAQEFVPAEADVVINRVTPMALGLGLLEAIDDADILALAANPLDPNVSGVVRMTQPFEGGPMRASKMGWKGGVATTLTFSADASLNEMGLTNRFVGSENLPNGDAALLVWDTVPDPEDFADPVTGLERIDRQTDFQIFTAPPAQTPRSGMTGEMVFSSIGCAACHVDTPYVTGAHSEAVLSGVSIKPYSDFLLHDMGTLGDGIVDGICSETEMMTRTLWGIGQRQTMLHDGRVTGVPFDAMVDWAIQEHDGEAAFSRTNWNNLSAADQAALVEFMKSLGRSEGDWDLNNRVDEFDWFFMEPLMTGPDAGTVTPDDGGAIIDIDQDGDIDMADMAIFQRAYTF
ncbi:MAG: di-heme oxidoredictase family protein [Planctomycetota bacterium]|nr:di-heme oxidoredictase family protein [Planctomycetota bacterium]